MRGLFLTLLAGILLLLLTGCQGDPAPVVGTSNPEATKAAQTELDADKLSKKNAAAGEGGGSGSAAQAGAPSGLRGN